MPNSWIFYVGLAILFWGSWGIFVKLALRYSNAWSVYIISSLPMVIIFAASFLVSRIRPEWSGPALPYAIIGGLLGSLGTIAFYLALAKGQAASVVPLAALYPGITLILAMLILKEHLSLTQGAGIALAILAGYLIAKG
jgi:transporter family protein